MKRSRIKMEYQKSSWWIIFFMICALSAVTRYYKLDQPAHVCWDETHFGKMASWYINQTFFFDVHPPLGKMLIALSGYLTGYNGNFSFSKPGEKYENFSYMGMRMFCALCGSCISPLCFIIVWELTKSLTAAFLSAFIVLCDWWSLLILEGICLACAVCVKFVGVFVIFFAGLMTITELWHILGNLNYSLHFCIRSIFLILLPIFLYLAIFAVHFAILKKSGTGDGHFSSSFQARLENNFLHDAKMPYEVAYGAVITLKNWRPGGGYLHSHAHLYPPGIGARQQQITVYFHKDENNLFLIKPFNKNLNSDDSVTILRNHDLIRLEHIATRRNLHSHREKAPLTKRHYQVTGYGENGTGDANDVWKIDIVHGKKDQVLTTMTTQFRLIHYLMGCALYSHNQQLPNWGWEQLEVTCNPNIHNPNNIWNVEENHFAKLSNESLYEHASSFISSFIESHIVMIQNNAGLKPKEGEMTSRPWQWPLDFKGQFFSLSPFLVYMLGNPIIFWGNLICLLLFCIIYLYLSIYYHRNQNADSYVKDRDSKILDSGCWLFLGWLIHYLPFWFMSRILYFHHYFPALIFNCMLSGVLLDYLIESVTIWFPPSISSAIFHWIFGIVSYVVLYSFYLFYPLTYGIIGNNTTDPNSSLHKIKWWNSWEF